MSLGCAAYNSDQGIEASLLPDRLVVINDARSARGGATGLALLSVRLLRELGVSVTYFCGEDDTGDDLGARGVEVLSLGGRPLLQESRLRAVHRGLYNGAARKRLAAWIAERDTPRTVYHVHGWSKILSPSIFSALQPVRRRTWIHAHDFFLACPNGGFMDYGAAAPCGRRPLGSDCLVTHCDKRSYSQKLWRVGRQAVLRQLLDRQAPMAGIVMIHEGMTDYFIRSGYPRGALTTLRNPAEPFNKTRVPVEENMAAFFVGRLDAEKGIEDAIAAAERAGLPLVVAGDGPLRESLAARHDNVRFLGWCTRPQIAAEIARARVLVMPTRYPEPFGLVAAEAALSGIPLVLSKSAFLSTEVAEGGIGFSIDTRDPSAFAAILARVRSMGREELKSMSERAAGRSTRLATTPEEWRDGLVRLYASALAEEGRR